ncbi:MAG: hypothetical protein ACR2O3_12745 [Rhizobiaceae bacterium]
MQLTAVAHAGLLVAVLSVAGYGGSSDRVSTGQNRQNIYTYMSQNFKGNPTEKEVRMLSHSVFDRYETKLTKKSLYEMGGYLFKLARKTGVPEVRIMSCMIRQNENQHWVTAANRCVGSNQNGLSTIL